MKGWKTSSATYEPRNARPSFRLDPQWSGCGSVLPQATSQEPETGLDPAKPPGLGLGGLDNSPSSEGATVHSLGA